MILLVFLKGEKLSELKHRVLTTILKEKSFMFQMSTIIYKNKFKKFHFQLLELYVN